VTKEGMIQLARAIAARYNLPPEVVCGQIERESNWIPWSIRYEAGFMSRYVAPLYAAGHVTPSEAYARSFSWGLMQVLGQVAREFGFVGEYLSELCDPPTGVEYGCKKLAKCFETHGGDMNKALESYNGGNNTQYSAEVLALSARYTQQV
jgi:soluble lytic murein transglycosylase-like protein